MTSHRREAGRPSSGNRGPFLRFAIIGLIWLVSAAMLLAVFTVGRCDFAGGRCPADPESLLQNDNFGTAALATFAAVAGAIFLSGPSRRRAAWAVGVGLAAALLVGSWATSI